MGRNRFVQPDIVRLPLSDGDYLDVKRYLTIKEVRRIFVRQIKPGVIGEKQMLNPDQVGLSKVMEYVVGWSFTDQDGRPVPFSEDAVENLDPESFQEILAAVDAHEERQDQEKKQRDGRTTSVATSPSHDGVAGATSGSLDSTLMSTVSSSSN
jgi:hypothetical protein